MEAAREGTLLLHDVDHLSPRLQAELMAALSAYPLPRRRRIFIEYTLISGKNDELDEARKLARLLRDLPVKINLIPMNPIDSLFSRLRASKRKAFIPFLTAGDPDVAGTVRLARALAGAGASLLELGFPYSDPIADGPVIQASYTRALARHLHVAEIFAAVTSVAGRASAPLPPLVAMVETAQGVLNAVEIARTPGVLCVAFGRFDLSADLGVDPDGGSPALAAARAAVVLASTAADLHPPIDSPWLKIHDLEGLRAAAQRGRADGFGGMQLIHPSHVDTVNEVFSPTAEELAWARGIVASADQAASGGRGAYTHDGQMVDEAVVKRARFILRNAPG